MSSEDFLSWDDIPLQYFLGEFTEDEAQSEPTDSDDHEDELETHARPERESRSQPAFQCPLCPKMYASISGFRGHVCKKHDSPHLKGEYVHFIYMYSDHRIGANNTPSSSSSHQSSAVHTASQPPTHADVKRTVEEALKSVQQDSNLEISPEGAAVQKMCREFLSSIPLMGILTVKVSNVIGVLRHHLLATAVEKMWATYHSETTDENFTDDIVAVVASYAGNTPLRITYLFVVCFLEAIPKCVIKLEKDLLHHEAERVSESLSTNDQGVLYYIAGNLLHCMLKKGKKPDALNQVETMCASEGDPAVPQNVRRWLESQDRGGLKKPVMGFFHLVMCFETVIRREVDIDKLEESSLATDKLKEAIFADSMVQSQWRELTGHSGLQKLLEAIVMHFVTVRGFAIAKLVMKKVQKQRRLDERKRKRSENTRRSFSLRRCLE
ncbi:hypothetical protein BaRGS_00015959 [Batillaria attramentaria]|uniref:C2H2-type domain-containing protein n=1 Tax=Batillaria attramentaria TaxID=370345 RepID=A0ABD0KZY6_9CAEN